MCTSMLHFTTSLKIVRVLYYVSSEFEKPRGRGDGKAKIELGSPKLTRGGRKLYSQNLENQTGKTKIHLIREGGPLNTLQVLNALE